jgi:glutamyl-tRNA reductase
MNLICLGISHQIAPVEIRERLAFSEKEVPDALRDLLALDGVQEAVVLNTCNRVEVYAVADHAGNGFAGMEEFFRRRFGLAEGDELPFYRKSDRESAIHLFRVASGLESMVLGETEIFGQVKKAYATAQGAGTTARVLNKLFQQSFQIGKHLRNNTQIQRGSTSVGSVAVDLAEKVFGDLQRCHVMLIGAGDMSRVVAQSLLSRGAKSVIVSNRSHDRAVELAEAIGGEAIRFDDWESRVPGTDIIITSTSAPHIVIHADAVSAAMKSRRGRPLIIIDIAVPRDVDPLVAKIPDVYLYPIDSLAQIADGARRKREAQIRQCDRLLLDYLEEKGIAALESARPSYPPVQVEQAEQGGTAG